jgi:photosystem II stability/assembly factor-like uncharacterized protein
MIRKPLIAACLVYILLTLTACGYQTPTTPVEVAPATATSASPVVITAAKSTSAPIPTATPTEAPASYASLTRLGDHTWGWLYPRNPGEPALKDIYNISCPSVKICYALTWSGEVLVTNDGGFNWQQYSTGLSKFTNSITCPTITTCFVTKQEGGMVVSHDSGRTWQEVPYGSRTGLAEMSCPDKDTCYAIGQAGLIVATTDGGQSWIKQVSNTNLRLGYISCPSKNVCYIRGGEGDYWDQPVRAVALATTDAGKTWNILSTDRKFPGGLTCPSAKTCYGVIEDYVTDTMAAPLSVQKTVDGGQSWKVVGRAGGPAHIYCPNENICYLGSYGGPVSVTTDGGESWKEQIPPGARYGFPDISCPTPKLCFLVSNSHYGDAGAILTNGQ